MSADFLTIDKQVSSVKTKSNVVESGNDSKSTKDSPSLFDSLLKEAETSLDSNKNKDLSKNKDSNTQDDKTKNKELTSTKSNEVSNSDSTEKKSKEMVEKLVEIVVEKAKDKSTKEESKDSNVKHTDEKDIKSLKSEDSKDKKATVKIEKDIENTKELPKDSNVKHTDEKDIKSLKSEDVKDKIEDKKATVKTEKDTESNNNFNLNINKQTEEVVKNSNLNITNKSESISSNTENVKQSDLSKTPLMANMFLSSQKQLKDLVSKEQVSNAKKNIEENKTLNSIKTSAKMLDLDATDAKVDITKDKVSAKIVKKETNTQSQSLNLNKMFLNNQIVEQNIVKQAIDSKLNESQIIASVQKDVTVKEKETVITMTAPMQVVETIQNKIIGAQQKVGTFMSDVARNMYLNYKPPVNAFRINLNPANLGSISIVMRSNKADNTVNVSMNMSNSSTMEVFSENKSSLQSALMKNLNDGSNVSLDFNMQGDSSEGGFEQFNQNKDNQENGSEVNSALSSDEEEQEVVVEDTDYM